VIQTDQVLRPSQSQPKTEIELRPAVRRIDDSDSTVRNKFERVEQVEADRLYMEFEPGETDAAERREIKQEHRDQVRLESKDREGEHQLELESRNIRARLHQGAQFELNSETNEVSLITPSGEQKILNHLPDQAIERMQAAGLFSGDALESELLQVAVNSDTQQLEYRQKMYKQKRLFGLFNRQVGSNVVLNDETGEIHEEQHSTGFARLLDSLSI